MTRDRLIRLAAMVAVLGLPATVAPLAQAAQRAPVAGNDYRWIDRADALWEAIGDAPPDFTFSFQGLEPWAWQTADGHVIVVEDAGEQGGIRSYYFAPGALTPFLAVEPGASFGFTGTKVAMVYGPDGGALAKARWGKRPARGLSLFARARLIKRAMDRERYGVDPYAWSEFSEPALSFLLQWDIGRTRYSGWRAHRGSTEGMDRRRRLDRERAQRRGEASDFERWRRGNFRGSPPAGFDPRRPGGYRPRPDGAGNNGAGMPPRPYREQRYPRPQYRERDAFDPALTEPMVPASPPRWQPGRDRFDPPARPALDNREPAQRPGPATGGWSTRPQRPAPDAQAPSWPAGEGRPSRPQRPAPDAQGAVPPQPQPPAGGERPSRPQRPAPDTQAPVTPQPQPPAEGERPSRPQRPAPEVQPPAAAPQPPVEPTLPPPPAVDRPNRPDRGEGRPPRVQPVAPSPQPIDVQVAPVEVAPPPEPVVVQPEPQPEAQPRPRREAPEARPRSPKAEWIESQRERPVEADLPPPAESVTVAPEPAPPPPEPAPPPPPPPPPAPPPPPPSPPPPAEPAPEASSETPG